MLACNRCDSCAVPQKVDEGSLSAPVHAHIALEIRFHSRGAAFRLGLEPGTSAASDLKQSETPWLIDRGRALTGPLILRNPIEREASHEWVSH